MNCPLQSPSESRFDMNFKIPKKKSKDDNCSNGSSAHEHKILENAYDHHESNMQRYSAGGSCIPRPPSCITRPPHNFQNSQPTLSDYENLPQLAYDATKDHSLDFQSTQSAHVNYLAGYRCNVNSLKRPREVPKNNNGVKYANTFPHRGDPTLPKELTEQFQPLYCKLCAAKLSSNSMAKLHYKSKNHEKKVRKFLLEYSERTGEPLHARAQIIVNKRQKLGEDNNPKYFHCDVCDLPLTGRLHAESHYMGKNHQRAMSGKAPAGMGHFNEEGKWVRRNPPVGNPSGGDGFGEDFHLPMEFASAKDLKVQRLYCDICSVKVTSEQQMTLHVSGHKHKKRLQHQTSPTADENVEGDPENNILSAISSPTVPSGDLSVYRTPTGFYYCNPCNVSLNSETQFKQHLGSKKHRKKANGNKE